MNQPTKTETLLGGADFIAAKKDGTTEAVKIRQLAVRKCPKLLAVLEDEPAIVELLCEKPAGWSDALTPESFEQIVIEGERINNDFFSRWVQRRLARQEKLLPGIMEQAVKSAGLNLRTTLPKSPSSPA